jgi:hypothetical protein
VKISKTKLRQIIKEEISRIVERVATVPQVQQMAAAAGARLSYGDAKTLAAQTPAERSALIQLQRAFKDGSWKRMREELKHEAAGEPLARVVGDIEFDRRAKEMSAARRERGEASTPASTTNLDRFSLDDPDEENPDEVGLKTLEMPEREYEQWRTRGFFGKDKF